MGRDIYERYLKKEKGVFVLLILIIGIGVGVSGMNPYIYGNIIDCITGGQKGEFEKWLIAFFGVLVLTQVLESAESVIGNWAVNHIENEIQDSLMKKMLSLKCREIDKYTEGELLNRLEFDAEKIIEYYLDLLTSILMIVLNLTISIYFILRISKKLSIIAFIMLPMLYLVNFAFHNKIHKLNKCTKQFEDRYYGFVNDIFSNLKCVKSFGMEEKLNSNYIEYLKKRLQLQMKNTYLTSFIGLIREFLGNSVNIVILFAAGIAIISGSMTIGNMVAFNSYLGKFFEAISKVMELNLNRQGVLVSYERMIELENRLMEEKETGVVLKQKIQKVDCRDLAFGYDDKKVLDGFNLEIRDTGIYSLVGVNGCGKSTLLKLLERFYEVDSGVIEINEKDIEKYTLSSLRKSIFYMAKESFFMQDTVINNLRMGHDEISDQEIIAACQRTGIHEEIVKLPKGYETMVEKGGKNFSSGQKQKMGFARVLLAQADLILLDEVTSDLDGTAEKRICDLMEEVSKKAMLLNISHKPESLIRSREVFLVENGRIIGSGTHQELLEKYEQYRRFFEREV